MSQLACSSRKSLRLTRPYPMINRKRSMTTNMGSVRADHVTVAPSKTITLNRTRSDAPTARFSRTMRDLMAKMNTMTSIGVKALIRELCLVAALRVSKISGSSRKQGTSSGVRLRRTRPRRITSEKYLTNSMNFSTSRDKQLSLASREMIQEAPITKLKSK